MSFRVAIDTGGTFIDGVCYSQEGDIVFTKVPTSPENLINGFESCLASLAAEKSMDIRDFLGEVTTLIHGTTYGLNLVHERKGPKLGLITTRGHRDVIQLRRVVTSDMFDWQKPFPEPLVPRWRRVEVTERVDLAGNVLVPLDEEDVHRAISYFKKLGVTDVVIGFLFSFANPEHEKRAKQIVERELGGAVVLSHEALPMPGEYERFNIAVLDAYVRPGLANYLERLNDFLEKRGFRGQLLFMQNNGGVVTAEVALRSPSTLLLSGPSAGPAAALLAGQIYGYENVLSVDMGGTSFDVSTIVNGNVFVKRESVINEHLLALPIVDVESVGAGGGSVGWFDETDILRVGPISAGADPGPACYGWGGTEGTLTDAFVVAGYIDPDYFLRGKMKLREDLAREVIKQKVAPKFGGSVEKGAAAMLELAASVAGDCISSYLSKRGFDPRDFVLVVGGGAGPTLVPSLIRDLNIREVLIPWYAAVFCSVGMLSVDLRHEFERFYRAAQGEPDIGKVTSIYGEMEAEATSLLDSEGVPRSEWVLKRTARMRYWGQFRGVEVEWPSSGPVTEEAIARGIDNFHKRQQELFGHSDPNYPVEFLGFGLKATGRLPKPVFPRLLKGAETPNPEAIIGTVDAYFSAAKGLTQTKIYQYNALLAGNKLEGPCIVRCPSTTIVIPPDVTGVIDEYGNCLIKA